MKREVIFYQYNIMKDLYQLVFLKNMKYGIKEMWLIGQLFDIIYDISLLKKKVEIKNVDEFFVQ